MKTRKKLRRPSCSRTAPKKVHLTGWTIETGTHALEFMPDSPQTGLILHTPLKPEGGSMLLGEVRVGHAPSSTQRSEKTGKPAPRVSVCVTLYLDPPVFFDLEVSPEDANDAARRMALGAVFDLHAAPKAWPEEAEIPRQRTPPLYADSRTDPKGGGA